MNKLLIWICENSYLTFCIVALLFLLSLLFFGCTTTPAATPPSITPEIRAKTSEINGDVVISNSTLAVYLVTVRDKKANIIFKEYIKPQGDLLLDDTKIIKLKLRAGEYLVCFKSSGLWGRIKCFNKIVEVGKEHQWKIRRK